MHNKEEFKPLCKEVGSVIYTIFPKSKGINILDMWSCINFQNSFKVYGREGHKIKGYEIKKEILYGRSTFFCPKIQK